MVGMEFLLRLGIVLLGFGGVTAVWFGVRRLALWWNQRWDRFEAGVISAYLIILFFVACSLAYFWSNPA